MDLSSTIELNCGVAIPRLGLGVFRTKTGGQAKQALSAALKFGYRHIDTAAIYRNEVDVGAAVRASGLARGDVFITTKLWNADQGFESALQAFDVSLERLGVDYVDLYLLHWPVSALRIDSWRALEQLHRLGRAKAIGVSNFTVRHLDELIAASDVVPAVNQVELSPFMQQRELVSWCRARGIVVEAYSPLTRARKLDDPGLVAIAADVGKSPAQVLIRWALQTGLVVLPKSTRPKRIKENMGVFDFELTPDQMDRLDALEEGLRVAWDPTEVP